MDEIILEGKTYISTKRAAKDTGYAKDYVGQLCREGRVPARLVGRSWYVLASAIREHRFGEEADTKKTEPAAAHVSEQKQEVPSSPRQLPSLAWEPARYAAVPNNTPLPSINRLERDTAPVSAFLQKPIAKVESRNATSDMQAVWSDWFSAQRTEPKQEVVMERTDWDESPAPAQAPAEEQEEGADPLYGEDSSTNVPIHRTTDEKLSEHEAVPKPVEVPRVELARESEQRQVVQVSPRAYETYEAHEVEAMPSPRRKESHLLLRSVAVVVVLLAILSASIAYINSGYGDSYKFSSKQVQFITGFYIVNK